MAYEETLVNITLEADDSIATRTGVPGLLDALTSDPGVTSPVTPSVNYSGYQYRFVKLVDSHKVGLATADTDQVVGVLQSKPQVENMAATVAITGISKVEAGSREGVPIGAVTTDSEGRAVAATGDSALALGYAIRPASAVGELIPVLLRLNAVTPPTPIG
jgi:hypothetical protein